MPQVTVIRPSRGWVGLNLSELWAYRELFYFLAWRDVRVRYKQTVLGVLWAIIQPLLTMLVFSIFFGRLAGLEQETGGIPYPVFVYAGLLPWQLFANILTRSSESLIAEPNLVRKVFFPRLVIPGAAAGSCLVDFVMAFLVLVCIMAAYGMRPGFRFLIVPVLLLLTTVSALGVAMFLSAMNVAYRDFRYVIPFLVQIWMFLSPVIYPVTIVPENWRWLIALNPMTGIIGGWRSAVFDRPLMWQDLTVSAAVGVSVFFLGVAYFRRVERGFADII